MSAQTPWHITEASHGTFLCNGNYCVARLSDKDPQELFAQMNSHAQLLAERDALLVATAKLRELLDQINVAACYASEEDPCASREALLHIGSMAREGLSL